MRSAGHHRRGSRVRVGRARVAFGACRRPEDNAKTVNRYLELAAQGKVDDIVELYAEDGTVEDPVGGEVHIGREAIRGFYSMIPAGDNATEMFTLRSLGQEAAFYWALTVELGGNRVKHRDHQHDDVQRRRQDRVDEGLLGPGEHQARMSDFGVLIDAERNCARRNRK